MPFLKNSSKNGYSAALKSVGCGERATFGDVSPFVEAAGNIGPRAAEDSRPYAKFKPERRNIMSTNKTENYGLHAWEASDDFLRQEFNENFVRIDGAVYDLLVTGTYTGDGTTSRTIELGFTPRALLLFNNSGATMNSFVYGGLALLDHGCSAVSIIDGGLRVTYQSSTQSNRKDMKYLYMALQ